MRQFGESIVNFEQAAAARLGMSIDEYRRYVQREAKARKRRHSGGSGKRSNREPERLDNFKELPRRMTNLPTAKQVVSKLEVVRCERPEPMRDCNRCKYKSELCHKVKVHTAGVLKRPGKADYSSYAENEDESGIVQGND